MKNKNIAYMMLLLIGCTFWACKKELNVYPTTSEVDGNVIVDTKSATTVLNGVYYRFANSGVDYNSIPSTLWTDVNETQASELSGLVVNANADGFSDFTYNAQSFGVDLVWNYGYALVNAANGFIKNVSPVTKIPAATKKEMVAEARFLRAFGDSELLLYYGQYHDVSSKYGIILRNEFVTSSQVNLPRSGVAAVYTAILGDLDTAIAGLPALNTQIYYANAAAAKLLKARVLINRGAAGDYAEVISLTNDIITSNAFPLETNVRDLFLTNGLNSSEVILGIQPFPNESYKFENYIEYNQFIGSPNLESLLINDPRNQWVYQSVNSPFLGPIDVITKYYSGDPNNPVQTPQSSDCYAFRATEAYLLEAEALTLFSGMTPAQFTQAKTLLKAVEHSAGITDFSAVNNAPTAQALNLLVIREEMKSFVAENGADWFAFRRLPTISAMQVIQPAISNVNQLILPIPNSELVTNSQAIQNPGY